MKKYLFLTIIALILFMPGTVFSQTESPSPSGAKAPPPSPTNSSDNLEKIKILKDKVATKVAQLRNSEKKGFAGTVKSKDKNQLVITFEGNDITLTSTEDTTVYSLDENGNRSDSSTDKIKVSNFLTVLGFYDDAAKSIEAKYIYISPPLPLHIVGKIEDIDRTNYTITIKTADMTDWTVDIETYTKTQNYSKPSGLQKSGFSKLSVGSLVHISGTLNKKDKNRLSALRILTLGDFSSPSQTPSTTPSSAPSPKS